MVICLYIVSKTPKTLNFEAKYWPYRPWSLVESVHKHEWVLNRGHILIWYQVVHKTV